ncbi:MAG: hypothetical protein QOE96_3180 [Blastocatellia bacterium]|jgi:hypothetical protein|nr:hypothetical protein [Blastocatellia bacterium]
MSIQTSPRLIGRILALLSLVLIVSAIFAQGFVSNRLIDFSSASTTANNILAHKSLFQLGFTVYLIEMTCNVATTALWYVLLRPVNRSVALVAAFIDLAGAVFKTFARVFFIAPLWVLLHTGSPVLSGFTSEQVQSIAMILLRVNNTGAGVAMAFFGFSVTLYGYLIFRSTFLPRWLGVLQMICGLCWLTFLYPPLGGRVFTYAAPLGLLSVVVMILLLLIRGVDEDKWRSRAAAGCDI